MLRGTPVYRCILKTAWDAGCMSTVSSTVLTRENKNIKTQMIDDARLASLIGSAKDSNIIAEVGAVSIVRLSIGNANPIVIVNLLEADKHQLLTAE